MARDVEQVTKVITALEEHSNSISMVLDVIRGIAEQTNLLALNAAIEAARAGEHGRGFSVVADEVRTLASRTQQSTQEIQKTIERLQINARDAVKVMAKEGEQAGQCVRQAATAGEALQAITGMVASISEMNAEIAAAVDQQRSVASEIHRNIVEISDVTEHNASNSMQTARASEELAKLATHLQGLVARFRV